MKIAVDCRMYNLSGIGTYLREILPYMLKSNNNFLLIGKTEELKNFKELKNVEIQDCQISLFSFKEIFIFPVKQINKCDIFYTPNYNIPGGIKIPVCSTIHDVIFLDMPELTSKLGYLIRKIFYKRAYCLSEMIFTVSNFSKKRIEYNLGKSKEIVITYNGISKYILEDDGILYEKKDYIIFVGNIKRHKGLKTLLLAYREAKKYGMSSTLLIVGNQNNFKTKDEEVLKILENSKDEGIEFTGYVDSKELKKLIAEAKVLVQPSLYEGFGIPPLEALALKTAVILSDIEVFNEIYDKVEVYKFKNSGIQELKNILISDTTFDIKNEKIVKELYSYKKCSIKILENLIKNIEKVEK